VLFFVLALAFVLLGIAFSVHAGLWQDICVALGCQMVIFLPLLYIERGVTSSLESTRTLAREATAASEQASADVAALAEAQMGRGMQEVADRLRSR
jgi:hypothetical protein